MGPCKSRPGMTVTPIEGIALTPGNAQPRAFESNASNRPHQGETRRRCEMQRPRVHGKFLFVADKHFWIRGVTYGTFRPDPAGPQFPPRDVVERDFRAIAAAGLNAVRVYTAPPRWLMDTVAVCGLRVMIGLSWEQHVAFLDDYMRVQRIVTDMRASVGHLAGHPAVLCYVVGNEIPASVVRWHGKSRIERSEEHTSE